MNQERLLEIERNFRALIDSLTAEEMEAELRRIEESETVSELEKIVSILEKPYQTLRKPYQNRLR